MFSLIKLYWMRLYFSLTGWLVLGLSQFLLAWLLFIQLEAYLKIQPDLTAQGSMLGVYDLIIAPILASTALALLLIMPLFCWQTHKTSELSLLLTAPLHNISLIGGQWLGLMLSALPLLVLVALMVGWLASLTYFDLGRLAAGGLGLLLLLGLSAAISLYFALTLNQPLAATALSWSLLILLWLLDADPNSHFSMISLDAHLRAFWQGQVRLNDLIYFAILTLAVIGLIWHRIWLIKGED